MALAARIKPIAARRAVDGVAYRLGTVFVIGINRKDKPGRPLKSIWLLDPVREQGWRRHDSLRDGGLACCAEAVPIHQPFGQERGATKLPTATSSTNASISAQISQILSMPLTAHQTSEKRHLVF